MGKQWKQWQTIFLGSKITTDVDCSYEIKRRLLLGRKAITNLDSILKSRDITLPTKVHLVKAMLFPTVMCGHENWTIRKAERQRIDAFEPCCWRRLLRVLWTVRRSNQSILKENTGRTDAEAEAPGLWPLDLKNWFIVKDPEAGKDWRQEEKWTTEDEMVGWHHWLDGHEFEQALGVGDGQGSQVCYSPRGRKELDTTERLNWTEGTPWPPGETEWVHDTVVSLISDCPVLSLVPALLGWALGILGASMQHPILV